MSEAPSFSAYLIFDFGEDHVAAERALGQVEQWVRAFKLHGQLLARARRTGEQTRLLVRLAFEEFEQLAFERWLERIPREAVFAGAEVATVRPGDALFAWACEWFGPV